MKTGAGLAFIAVGAILAFAIHGSPGWVNVHTVGWVLMLVGLVGMVLPPAYLRLARPPDDGAAELPERHGHPAPGAAVRRPQPGHGAARRRASRPSRRCSTRRT